MNKREKVSVEILDFISPDANRKSLFITGIPYMTEEELIVSIRLIFRWNQLSRSHQLLIPPPPLKKRHTHTFKNKILKKTTIYSVIFDLCLQELLHSSFSKYGLLYGTQVFPYTPRLQPPSPTLKDGQGASNQTGYYAFVNFYLAMSARRAKDDLNGKVNFKGTECKVCTSNQ